MAKKTNCTINGIDYYRLRVTIGYDRKGKDIIKNFYGTSKTDAETQKNKWMQDRALGINHINKRSSLSMAMYDWVWDILKFSKIKASSFERYEGIYRNYVEESTIGFMVLEDIQRVNIQKYYNELHQNEYTYSQIKNAHKILKMFFKYTIEEGYLLRNPCLGIELDVYKKEENVEEIDLFDEDELKVEIFEDEEIPKLLTAIKNKKLQIMVKFALGTGLRQGEILALNKTDIKNMVVQVTKTLSNVKVYETPEIYSYETIVTTPKSKKSVRKVPIPAELEKDLNELNKIRIEEKLRLGELYKDNELLFPSTMGTYIDSRNLIRSWTRSFDNMNIPYRKFHSLRHTYATQLLKNGTQLITVSRLLGHASVKTTEIYAHVEEKTKTEDVQSLNALFK